MKDDPMTQPTEAVGGEPIAPEPTDPFEEIAAEMLGESEPEEVEEEEGDEPEAETDEESEGEEEAEEEADDLPPIDAPNSLTPEEKEAFAKLPREAQEFTARRIGELEKGFNAKAQEAARARQETEQAANQQLAQIERQYAEHYQSIAAQFEPVKPPLELLATDQMAYFAQQRRYEDAIAQREQAQQTAAYYAQQAQARVAQAEQAYHAEQQQKIVEAFPEYLDPTTGPKLASELTAVARELGYSPDLIAQARADDILAMKTAAEWKAKAAKFDALQGKKMEKVRAAKGLPKVATPGVAVSSDQVRTSKANAAFERAKSAKSIGDRADAFGEWAKASGLI